MKSLSASIVAVGGLSTLVAGAMIRHSDTSLFATATGTIVAVLGLAFWIRSLSGPLKRSRSYALRRNARAAALRP